MADKYNGASWYGKTEQKKYPRYCGSCVSGLLFFDENNCPGCWRTPGKPHFRKKKYSDNFINLNRYKIIHKFY